MIPAGTALAQTVAASSPRLGFIYFPHGALRTNGRRRRPVAISTSRSSSSRSNRARLRDRRQRSAQQGRRAPARTASSKTWLNCVNPRLRNAKTGVGVTVDQIAARHLGKETSLPSLELCAEPGGMIVPHAGSAAADGKQSAEVFFGMFGQGDTQEERQAILNTTDSLLDYVKSTASLNRRSMWPTVPGERLSGFSPRDRAPRAETRAERQVVGRAARRAARSAGGFRRAPRRAVRDDRAGLADQSDQSGDHEDGRGSEHADVSEPGRPRGVPPDLALGRIPGSRRQPAEDPELPHAVFAKFVQRLKEMREGTGSVLDNSIILFGSNMANSDAHNNDPLPQALIGRGGGIEASTSTTSRTRRTRTSWSRCCIARACRRRRSRSSPTPARSRRCNQPGLDRDRDSGS